MRAAEFDREYVLNQAMLAFQQNGYNKTTMQQLTAATGLHPGSLYCAFGNKKGLLVAAVEHYVAMKSARRDQCFVDCEPLEGIARYLQMVAEDAQQQRCLVMRTLTEVAEQEPEVGAILRESLHGTGLKLQQALLAAQQQGAIASQQDTELLAQFLIIALQGLVNAAQCGLTMAQISAHVQRTLHAIRLEC